MLIKLIMACRGHMQVNQVENYYATQDTDHGYRPGKWEQRNHLKRLTTFPSDDDYSSGHDYRSNCNQIDEHFQSLALGSIPHFRGVGDRSYHNFGSSDNSSNAFSGYDFDQYSMKQELVVPMGMTNLLIAIALLIEVLDTISMVLSPSSLQGHIFLIMDHQPNHLSQHIQVMNNSFNHILTMQINVLICMLVIGRMMMMILSPLVIQHGID